VAEAVDEARKAGKQDTSHLLWLLISLVGTWAPMAVTAEPARIVVKFRHGTPARITNLKDLPMSKILDTMEADTAPASLRPNGFPAEPLCRKEGLRHRADTSIMPDVLAEAVCETAAHLLDAPDVARDERLIKYLVDYANNVYSTIPLRKKVRSEANQGNADGTTSTCTCATGSPASWRERHSRRLLVDSASPWTHALPSSITTPGKDWPDNKSPAENSHDHIRSPPCPSVRDLLDQTTSRDASADPDRRLRLCPRSSGQRVSNTLWWRDGRWANGYLRNTNTSTSWWTTTLPVQRQVVYVRNDLPIKYFGHQGDWSR